MSSGTAPRFSWNLGAIVGCALGAIVSIFLLVLCTGCQQQPSVVKQGVIWSVRWTEQPNSTTGLYRTPNQLPGFGGSYGLDMYGILYPTCLEIRFPNDSAMPTRVVPLNNIIDLQFGDGGVKLPAR